MSVAGNWNLKISTPMGEQQSVLVLEEAGGTVTGTNTSAGDTSTLDGVVVDGQQLTWEQKVTKPFPMTVAFDVTVAGDELSGTAKAGSFPGSKVTGSRA